MVYVPGPRSRYGSHSHRTLDPEEGSKDYKVPVHWSQTGRTPRLRSSQSVWYRQGSSVLVRVFSFPMSNSIWLLSSVSSLVTGDCLQVDEEKGDDPVGDRDYRGMETPGPHVRTKGPTDPGRCGSTTVESLVRSVPRFVPTLGLTLTRRRCRSPQRVER